MTVAAFPPYTYYWGDGVTTAFAYPFEVERPEDFVAYVDDVLVSNYTLTGLGNETGGMCTFSSPVPPGQSLLLLRQVPLDQETMYPAYSPFPAAAHEKTLDRLCMQVWQLQEQLERTTRFRQTIRPPWRNLAYPDPLANTVLGWDSAGAQWTLYPSGVTAIPIDPVSGQGRGKHTVELAPAAGTGQASAVVFPPGVLAVAVTVWVETTFGTSQGLEQVSVGTPERPDCWGMLPALTAETETSAGIFQQYAGQPQPGNGLVTLTAYGGAFDGTGRVYLTGHFVTFAPDHTVGYSYSAGTPPQSAPLPVASETVAGTTRYGTPAETTAGLLTTVATHPAGVKAALDARNPSGTALSVTRYASGGTTLETAPGLLTTANSGQLALGGAVSAPPVSALISAERDASTQLMVTTGGATGTVTSGLTLRACGGTLASPQAVPANTQLGFVGMTGYQGSAYAANQVLVQGWSEELWTGTAQGTSLRVLTTLLGQATRAERLRIHSNGYLGIATTTPRFPLHVSGRLACGVPNSAGTSDTDLSNGQLTCYLDGGETNLLFRVKTSTGVLKTGTVALT